MGTGHRLNDHAFAHAKHLLGQCLAVGLELEYAIERINQIWPLGAIDVTMLVMSVECPVLTKDRVTTD